MADELVFYTNPMSRGRIVPVEARGIKALREP